jgi:hypothetical protein
MERPFRPLLLLGLLFLHTGCVHFLPHQTSVTPLSDLPGEQSTPQKKPWKPWHLLPHLSLHLPFFHHKQPPPRAQALQRVGIIRTLSADGTFVIIELEPGIMIPAGRELIVTADGGEPIRLRAAESQPPYFIADIQSGQPVPGQTVFQ